MINVNTVGRTLHPPPPKAMKVAYIISKLRHRYMAWMEYAEWPLYFPLVDHMENTTPLHIANKPDFAGSELNLGAFARNKGETTQGQPEETPNVNN